ncbi:MAG: transcription termination factor NusA [Kiritimatiellia bacterium]
MNSELMTVINYLERDRGVNREIIIQAIESALLSAARKTIGVSNEVKVEIDRKSLQVRAFDTLIATDEDTGLGFMSLRRAREIKPDVQPGDSITLEIPPEKLGRIAAQTARQMILQKIRQAERDHVFEEYKDRLGDIVSGAVRQIAHRDLIVDIGKAEAIIPAKERIPTEEYQIGDRVRAYIMKVQSGSTGPALVLSRSCPEFVKALFRLEVSEIADGIVEVMGVARDPGFRSKIAVRSNDDKVDPVGACVGLRGTRVKNIVRELAGEKIDIVRWSDDIRQYVTQALSPARLTEIEIDPNEYNTVNITVDPDQLSLAIGRHGQNVRLTAKLTGWRVNIKKNETESFEEQVTHAIEQLAGVPGISREEADALVKNGFLTANGILAAEIPYIQEATGFDETTAKRIWEAAAATNPGEDDA